MALDVVIYCAIGFAVALMWNAKAEQRGQRYRRYIIPFVWLGWPLYLIGLMGRYLMART